MGKKCLLVLLQLWYSSSKTSFKFAASHHNHFRRRLWRGKNIKFTVGGALISKIYLLRFNGNDGTHTWCCWVGDTKMTLRNYIILPTSNTIKSNTRRYAIWSSSSFSSPSSWEFNCIKISPWSFILISLSFCSPSFFISPCPSWLYWLQDVLNYFTNYITDTWLKLVIVTIEIILISSKSVAKPSNLILF